MKISDCHSIHQLLVEDKWVDAGRLVLKLINQTHIQVRNKQQAIDVCRSLFQYLVDNELYLHAATLQWGPDIFNTGPESTVRVFEALRTGSTVLLMGASSMSKTYAAGAFFLLDYLRDPLATTVKLAAVNEDHLRKNLFAHVATLYRACAIPSAHEIQIRDSDLWMGVKEAGYEFGISGIAFKQSQETSGQFKGYKAKPVRVKPHPKFGVMSRLRVLGDECVRGDQRVSMGDGELMDIRTIVEARIHGTVLSLNEKTMEVEPRKIIGWHKVPLNGRKMVNVHGVIVTQDHPVFTKNGTYELAEVAETCFIIGHEELPCIGNAFQRASIISSGRVNGRFVNVAPARSKAERSNEIYARVGPTGLSEVEEVNAGNFCVSSDPGAIQDGVRRNNLSSFIEEPSRIHENPRDGIQGRKKEIYAGYGSTYGRIGNGGLVHGRREHLQEQELQNSHGYDFDILIAEGRRGFGDSALARHGDRRKGEAEQRKIRYKDERIGDSGISRDGPTVHPSMPFIQANRFTAATETGESRATESSDNLRLPNLRDAIQENRKGCDVRAGLQQEATPVAGEQEIQEDSFVYCIDVEDNHNFFAEGVCLHNCQNWPNGPFKDFNSLIASKSGPELIKIACAFNPESMSQHVTQLAEPIQGWDIEDIDKLYDYESKAGWKVCRLDAAKSENVIQRKVVYQGLQTYEGFISYLKAGGDSSANYFTFARGFPPLRGSINTIIPPGWPQSQRGEAIFIENPTIYGSVDLAFMGKDSAQMAIGRWGLASGWRNHMGKVEIFKDRLNVAKDRPRHVLQIDQILPLQKSDNTVTMAEEIMGKCKMLGVKPENLAIDKTSIGLGTYSHLTRVWGEVFGVSWNERATERRILAEDKEGADKQCDGVMSEMWWAFRRWLDPVNGAIFVNPIVPTQPLHTQLTSRRYRSGSKGIKVEPKEEYKSRNGGTSPDESDAIVMLVHAIRKNSSILPGLVESSGAEKRKDTSTVRLESFVKMVNTDTDDAIGLDGEDSQ